MSRRQPYRTQHNQYNKNHARSAKPSACQTEQSREMREQEMIANLNRENIHQYLRGLEVASDTEQMAGKITRFSAQKIVHGLKNGAIEIAKNPPPLPEKTTNSPKLSSQELKELESRARRESIAKKIEYLNEQIRGQTPKEADREGNLLVDFKDVLTREEHERKMKEIVQGKIQQRRRMEQLQEQQARKHKEEEQKKQAMRLLQQQKQKQAKRLKIQEKINHRKEEHEKFIEMGQMLQKEVAKVKQTTKLYEEMEKRYQSQILLPSLQEKKNKLKEIRDFHRRYDVEAIKEHQRQYLQRSQEKSEEKREKSPEWKYEPPSRSQRLSKLLKNEELEIKQHLESRRKKLEEMQKRQELYKLELKEKHKPKIDDDKKKEIQIRLIQQQRKYQKMHPNLDQRRIGEGYLEIAKKMKRAQSVKDTKQEQNQRQLQQKQKQPKLSSSKVNHSQQFYQGLRRKKMEDILHCNSKTNSEKYMMLKMETQKLGEKLRQKQELVRYQQSQEAQNDAAQLLLSSITAKMGMMNLMKNQADSDDSF